MDNRHHETSVHPHPDDQKVDYNFLWQFAYFKQHSSDFAQVVFFDARDAENDFASPFDTLKYRFDFTEVDF
jgi:hypothetical protein